MDNNHIIKQNNFTNLTLQTIGKQLNRIEVNMTTILSQHKTKKPNVIPSTSTFFTKNS